MDVETLLRSTVPILETVHVLGGDAEKMGAAIKNIKTVIAAIDKAKEEEKRANHDEQRKNV